MALASGTTFAGYTVLRMLEFGATGEVYLAQHPRLARQEVLRVLPGTFTADSDFGRRFLREADIVARLHHTNIAEIYDRGEYDGRLWVATEYVAGTSVAQLIAQRYPSGMPASEAFAIIAAIAEALDHAHQRGWLHRDVRPDNILLSDTAQGEQRILLTNFGLTRHAGERHGPTTYLMGESAGYVAPEQSVMGTDLDGRADQYGLAATAFHLFTGAPPHRDSADHLLSVTPPKLSNRRPELAPLDGVLATALARRPADRFGSCRELADALISRTGGWVGQYSPEAVLGVVDYPDDDTEAAAGAGAATERANRARPATLLSLGRARRVKNRSSIGEADARARRRWPWILLGGASGAAAVLLGAVLVITVAAERNDQRRPAQAAGPSPSRPPAAAPSHTPGTPAPGQELDGSYQVDVNREQQTYNGNPDSQPPNVTTWWAFHSRCTPTGCVAAGIMLDNTNHLAASAQGGDRPLVLDFRDGAWQSRPETVLFPCLGPTGATAKQTTTQVLSLQPQGNGPLHGVMTVTVESDECGQKGAQIVIPATAGRTGGVPPDVTVPEPPAR
jgi:serine/threonine-protein kinase